MKKEYFLDRGRLATAGPLRLRRLALANGYALSSFCAVPRTRQEIAGFLGIRSVQYAMKRYVEPLVASGAIVLAIPDRLRSRKQTYQAGRVRNRNPIIKAFSFKNNTGED